MELSRMALAAMDSEPVELPLDYLQGHKDGLEWAAQLAEANHPETGDWLYDDPIELAKAIRKGPDMPPVQPVADSEPVAYIFKHPAGRLFWSLTDESNKGHDDVMPVYDSPQSPGSEPATVPGKWIPVSERMPDDRTQVILWDAEIGEVTSGHYSHKTHTFYHCGDDIENEITHWMAPPAAPQEVSDA
ncbi:TPA: DUF551 domain-containing protein [Klebsiella pneumoniae]|nr:DUF551 domain-containing protein [Klebsiella pneumoniae]